MRVNWELAIAARADLAVQVFRLSGAEKSGDSHYVVVLTYNLRRTLTTFTQSSVNKLSQEASLPE